jgi:tRNA pseudouridine-54 N-methylase
MNIDISIFKEGEKYINEQRIEIFNKTFNTNFSSTKISRLIKNLLTSTSSRINGKKTIMFQIIPQVKAKENTIIQEDILQNIAPIIDNSTKQEDIAQNITQENTKEDEEVLLKRLDFFEEKLKKLNQLKKYKTLNLLEEYGGELETVVVKYDDNFNIKDYIDLRQKHYEMYEIFDNIDHDKPLPEPRSKPKKEPKNIFQRKQQ